MADEPREDAWVDPDDLAELPLRYAGALQVCVKVFHAGDIAPRATETQGEMLHVVRLPVAHAMVQGSGMNLAAIRRMRGLSQRALGEMIGKDAATINRAEAMHRSATLLTYQKCAEALGVTLADLFTDERSAIEAELVRVFRRIPEDRYQELLGLLRLAESRAPSEAKQGDAAGPDQAD